MPPGRLRRAGPDRADGRHRGAPGAPGRGHHARAVARSPAPCCSATSRSSCTRATPRSPSAGPPPSRWTPGCWPSCWARPSCASCSTPTSWPSWSGSSSGSPRTGASRTSRASPTCCGCSGPLTDAELADARRRARPGPRSWRRPAARSGSGSRGADHWAAVEDAGRLRDALGTALPVGVPEAFTEPVKDPLGDLLSRYARTHGPFTSATAAARFGLGTAVTDGALHRLAAAGRVVQGEFHPAGIGQEWCDATVLRRLRRRSLAALRAGAGAGAARRARRLPAAVAAPRRQQPARHRRTGARRRAVAGRRRARPPPWRSWSCRPGSPTTRPALLDELTTTGEVVWAGAGALPGKDGWISLYLADTRPAAAAAPAPAGADSAARVGARPRWRRGYGLFFRQIADQVRATTHPEAHRSPTGRRRLGPGLVGTAHQRHPRAAALPARLRAAPRAPPRTAPGGPSRAAATAP